MTVKFSVKRIIKFSLIIFLAVNKLSAQENSLVNTLRSPFARLSSVNIDDVHWTKGFWADRFAVCRDSMIPKMTEIYMDPGIVHAYRNFEIAAGKKHGIHQGPPFNDGDFYKLFESMAMVYAITRDTSTDRLMDSIIATIADAQRNDGYIHTPVIIDERNTGQKSEFTDRLNFETYNMGHLMTAACIHYRATGKKTLLGIAVKAADFLYEFYNQASPELARSAICPSHYMGVIEMYRTTGDRRYLELAGNLIRIRSMVTDGTDQNQDRIPFKKQTMAVGHAVRANYLYAGAADVYAETGDDSLYRTLDLIWKDITGKKMYITGGCGALYDGVSPDGTTYDQSSIQQVHQAYGRDYQLPNMTAHNESCANVGNILWNWRMFQITGDARFMDVLELTAYNALLAGVSLDGTGYFYTNPLCVSDDLPFKLRWSKEREPWISYSNCCPPNIIRTVSEIHNYVYSLSDEGLWINLYGSNQLSTHLKSGSYLKLSQQTEYPWNGHVRIIIEESPDTPFSVFLRIPGWCDEAQLLINGKPAELPLIPGRYVKVNRKWKAEDSIILNIPMHVKLMEANPLVEAARNQIAVKRGPVVYCLESQDIPEENRVFGISVPSDINLRPETGSIRGARMIFLQGEAEAITENSWQKQLYQEMSHNHPEPVNIRLIPYYAWGNRGHSEMTVWMPVIRTN